MPITLDLPTLQADFTGKLIGPTDADYDRLRTVFVGGVDRKPAMIVLAENAADVQKAVGLAHSTGLELAIRSGGHSAAGHGVNDGGIVLDLRHMKHIEVDESEKAVWAEPGLTAAELTKELDKHDLVLGFGDTGSVGIGGITLNGGIGFLVRQFGMAIDNLLGVEMVTADGQLLKVDYQQHPDLFWAIRGGGGNFGVVTRFHYRLHKVTEVYGGMLFLPAEPAVLAGVMAAAAAAPNELSGIFNVMPAPPMPLIPAHLHGQLIIMGLLMYAGPASAGEQALAPFRSLSTPLADTLHAMRYHEIFFPDDSSYHPTAAAETMFMHEVDHAMAETILSQLQASDASMRVVQLRALGGAMANVAADATAFAHRASKILVNVAAFYQGPEDKIAKDAWVQATAAKLNQGNNGAYVGFLTGTLPTDVSRAYPEATLQRLTQIKQQYDPANFFKLNVNIPPHR